jgi:glutamate-5-semialdehyde dehydrogenase
VPSEQLRVLTAGQQIPFGGDRVATVGPELAAAFRSGDRLVVVHETGDLLHVPAAEHQLAHDAVTAAVAAAAQLARLDDAAISAFFERFAQLLEDDAAFAPIAAANVADVDSARARGRSTSRLELTESMRGAMVAGLRGWRDTTTPRDALLTAVDHGTWTVATRRAPLGVVGFVFEGRPNVFADAAGVLRTGNAAVMRIGGDALGTATAIVEHGVRPAAAASGLPEGALGLVASTAHAAGWALFTDRRLGLAVARGSGHAVAQLGAVARQHGVAVSLHGTGGAWMVVDADADLDVLERAVRHSLDRKVCNTLNVCCVVAEGASRTLPVVLRGVEAAATARGAQAVVHVTARAAALVPGHRDIVPDEALATEWEWEHDPELTVALVDDIDEAAALCNRWSPRFVASLVAADPAAHERFYQVVDAPFVGNGFTRWVDGQFAFDQPELGLSNWQGGRLLARGGVLSGDSVHTVRTVATVHDHDLHR